MNNQRYTVVLKLDSGEPRLRQRVIERLGRIDPSAHHRLKNLNQGQITLKKHTDLATARRLVAFLKKTGAECKILKEGSSHKPAAPQSQVTDATPDAIRCPNCRHEQPPAIECQSCGVIIEKAHRHRIKAFQREAPRPETPKPADPPPPRQPLYQRIIDALPEWVKKPIIKPKKIQNWWRRLADRLIACGVVSLAALVMQAVLLHVFNMLWFLYGETEVGKYYIRHFPEKAAAIQHLMAMDLLVLAWGSTLTVLCVCLLLSVPAQLLHLVRYLFDSQGWVGKLVIWCPPAAALAAWWIAREYELDHYLQAVALVLVPSMCIISTCLQMTRDALPEFGQLWNGVANVVWKGENSLWTQIKRKWLAMTDADT